ncbi:MAG: VTT domain-containing protein [Pseudomonadota bacterium]
MADLFNQLLDWVSIHTLWAGVAVFLVAFSESVAILGLLVPGVVLMFGFGALIATGALEFWPVFWWAVAGAVAGDGMSFWLGRHFQAQLRGFWPFSRHPRTLQRGIDFFQKYGGKSVAIGRFFGPVRAVIPLVAGMLSMPPWRFYVANLLSALVWAPAYLLPGIVLGASLELASEVALRLVLLLLILLASLWLALLGVHGFYRIIQPYTSRIVQAIFSWGGRHRGLREIAQALANPSHPEFKGLTQLASLLILSMVLFALVAGAIPSHTEANLDSMLYSSLQSLRSPWADELMVHFTRLGDLSVILIFASTVAGFLLLRGDRRAAGYWLAATLFGLLAPVLLKYGLRIPRPDSGVEHLGPWSFPSAHVLRVVTVYGFFSVMIARSILRDWRWVSYGLVAIMTAGIGLSRLYLGVHWLSDVLGSLLLGLAWISGLGIAYHRHVRAETHPFQLTLTAAAVLLITLGSDAWLYQREAVARFQPALPLIQLSEESWRRGDSTDLPEYREDARGRMDHPLDIQFGGELAQLASHLQDRGWQPAKQLGWGNLLRLLSPSLPLQQLPVLPQVHDGRHEQLALERHLPDGGRLVLRLWRSPFQLDRSNKPIWLGSISSQHKTVVLNLLSYPVTEASFDSALATLREDLAGLDIRTPTGRRKPLLITD